MNLKKFKKSLVSIVLGSSLFLGNRGVICQHPKAWFTDNFFTTARETYKDDQNIQLLLMVSEFLSDLRRRPSTLNTEPLQRTKKLFGETSGLTPNKVDIDYLKPVLKYLVELEGLTNGSEKLGELQEELALLTVNADNIKGDDRYLIWTVAVQLEISIKPTSLTDKQESIIAEDLRVLCLINTQQKNSARPTWMIKVLTALLTN